ncbi:hypothetical protein BZA77DRAFT_310286 [Pyronema omphalodes]|nr:hypothetical protein BZA77DRAFT_310286 [Pyronema omphalodes]
MSQSVRPFLAYWIALFTASTLYPLSRSPLYTMLKSSETTFLGEISGCWGTSITLCSALLGFQNGSVGAETVGGGEESEDEESLAGFD